MSLFERGMLSGLHLSSRFLKNASHLMPPIIAVASIWSRDRELLNREYATSVFAAGGVPVIVPVTSHSATLESLFGRVDGAFIPGGFDIDPHLYGEAPLPALGEIQRPVDDFQLKFIDAAVKSHLPVFGICRGYQLLNVYFGGTLHQDIPTTFYTAETAVRLRHGNLPTSKLRHRVSILKGTNLKAILGRSEILINSIHHQAVKSLAPGFRVTAVAPDGLIEAIEKAGDPRVFGVQWHPEIHVAAGELECLPLFEYLVEQARIVREQRSEERGSQN
jgi:putative glutamine amidotransferase